MIDFINASTGEVIGRLDSERDAVSAWAEMLSEQEKAEIEIRYDQPDRYRNRCYICDARTAPGDSLCDACKRREP